MKYFLIAAWKTFILVAGICIILYLIIALPEIIEENSSSDKPNIDSVKSIYPVATYHVERLDKKQPGRLIFNYTCDSFHVKDGKVDTIYGLQIIE